MISPVRIVGLGGLFICASDPAPVGSVLKLLFQVPGGEVRARAVVRSAQPGIGMGIEFTGMNHEHRARLHQLISKLLRSMPVNASER